MFELLEYQWNQKQPPEARRLRAVNLVLLAFAGAACSAAAAEAGVGIGTYKKIDDEGEDPLSFTEAATLGASRASILEGMCERRVPPPHGTGF